MHRHRLAAVLAILTAVLALLAPAAIPAAEVTLLNVSYDPTRELYQDFNAAFIRWYKARIGDDVIVTSMLSANAA